MCHMQRLKKERKRIANKKQCINLRLTITQMVKMCRYATTSLIFALRLRLYYHKGKLPATCATECASIQLNSHHAGHSEQEQSTSSQLTMSPRPSIEKWPAFCRLTATQTHWNLRYDACKHSFTEKCIDDQFSSTSNKKFELVITYKTSHRIEVLNKVEKQ